MNNDMLELFEDLRFYIGAFFLIVGAVLTVQGLTHDAPEEQLNLITGLSFMAFSLVGLSLSLYSHWKRSRKPAQIPLAAKVRSA